MIDFNSCVRDLLDKIDEQYPASRLDAISRKWRDLWNFDMPFSSPPVALHRGRYQDGYGHPVHHTLEDRQRLLLLKLQDIVRMSDIDDDYMPVLTLDTGAYILAQAFGGNSIYMSNMYMIDHFLNSEADVENLPAFTPEAEHCYMDMVFETLRFFREETGGRIPINIHTPQGPLETLGCMWDSNAFYMSLIDNPELIVRVLEKILEGYIWYIKRQQAIIGSECVQYNYAMSYSHRPGGTGIGLGEDVIATIGPEHFDLTLPLYRRIASELGPLLLHSCGNPAHQLAKVMDVDVIHGLHFSQLNAEDFIPLISRPIVVHSRNDWESFEQLERYAEIAKQHNMRIAYQFQSLGECMQVGTDPKQYDPEQMKRMFNRVKAILRLRYMF
jgi:Uroporphyrinogen decarboxylase (URO-D)